MAVVQLRNGIYVNSIETVPDADQTAAYKYASLFTKHRKENWSMAQKQAASEIADAKERDAALLKVYGQQLKDYNDRLQQLDQDIAGAGTDVAKANAATQRTALQESSAQQKNAIDWQKAKAEQVSVSGGSRSSSTSTGTSVSTGGGGGGGGRRPGAASTAADAEISLSFANTGTDDVATALGGLESGPMFSQTIPGASQSERNAAYGVAVERLITPRKAAYENQGYSAQDAYDLAETDVKNEADAAGYAQYAQGHDAYKQETEGGGGGGSSSQRTSSSVSVREPATLQPRYKGLGEMPSATAVTAPTVVVDTKALEDKRKELAGQLADLIKTGAPASTVDDFITRSREIMAGRFGSVQTAPNYYQRNAAQNIGAMSQADADALYKRFQSSAEGAPVRITPTTPITAGTVAQPSPVTPEATPVTAPIVTGGSTPAVSPVATGATPATTVAVPTAADTVRAVENRRLGNYPIRQTELDALFPKGVPQEVLDAAAGIRKSTPSTVSGPTTEYSGGTVDASSMPARNSVYFPTTATNIGRKPEVAGDFNVPDMPRETETPAPGNPDYIPTPAYMPPKQPGGTFKWESKGYVEPSEEEKKQIQDILQKKREKRETPTGKTGYFQQRFDSAKEIVDQPGKLARLTASGPGKVAADVYNANKASGKDFKLTYDTLTATYEDDKEALQTAHQIALALDIANRNRTAPPKA